MSVLLISLPGTYPSFPAVGLEIIAAQLRKLGHRVKILNGHLHVLSHIRPELIRRLCLLNAWDAVYANLVYRGQKVGLSDSLIKARIMASDGDYPITSDELKRLRSGVVDFNCNIAAQLTHLKGIKVVGNQLARLTYHFIFKNI